MNRAERRTSEKKYRAKIRKMVKKGEYFLDIGNDARIDYGEKITIAGIRIHKNGRIDRNCEPGEETVFFTRKSRGD